MHLQTIRPPVIRWEIVHIATTLALSAFAPPAWRLPALAAAIALPAGFAATALLRRLRRPIPVPTVWLALPLAALWTLITARWTSGDIPDWWLPTGLVFTWFAVTLTAADLRSRRLPNTLTLSAYPALGITLAVAARASPDSALAWHALLGGGAFLIFHAAIHLWRPTSLGAGDVKITFPIGATLGAINLAIIAPAMLLASLITLTIYCAIRSVRRESAIPYGPGLLGAATAFAIFPDLMGGAW